MRTSHFAEAQQAALKSRELDPSLKWVAAIDAHALLFQGNFDEARTIYLALADQPVSASNAQPMRSVILADLQELRRLSVTHPDLEKIEALLKPPTKGS